MTMPDPTKSHGAASGERPAGEAANDNRVRLISFRRAHSNTLRGFATVLVEPPGLIVHDCPIHRSGERVYGLWPGKPLVDTDGRVLTDEHGKKRCSVVIEVPDGGLRRRISDAVVALVRRIDPEAFV
jgi:hypothetical protein